MHEPLLEAGSHATGPHDPNQRFNGNGPGISRNTRLVGATLPSMGAMGARRRWTERGTWLIKTLSLDSRYTSQVLITDGGFTCSDTERDALSGLRKMSGFSRNCGYSACVYTYSLFACGINLCNQVHFAGELEAIRVSPLPGPSNCYHPSSSKPSDQPRIASSQNRESTLITDPRPMLSRTARADGSDQPNLQKTVPRPLTQRANSPCATLGIYFFKSTRTISYYLGSYLGRYQVSRHSSNASLPVR